MHLLILDADPLILTTLTETVRRRHPEVAVHAATSFHAGLKKLTIKRYDAVIIDADLSDAAGVGALSMLSQRHPGTPVFLMAGQFTHTLLANATLSGVYYFLHKPIEPDVFMAVLNRVMESKRFRLKIDRLAAKATRHTKRTRKAIAYSRLLLEEKDTLLSRRQHSLAQSEEKRDRLTKIVDRLPLGLLTLDQSWRILWLNEAVPTYFRVHPREELLGRNLWEVCPEVVGSVFEGECRRAVDEQIAVRFLSRFPGNGQWYEIDAVPHVDGLSILFRGAIKPSDTTQENQEPDRLDPHPLLTPSPNSAPVSIQGEHRSIPSDRSSEDPALDTPWQHLAEQVQSAREAERARIARDLQDDLGQLVVALKTDLTWLDARLSPQQVPALLKVRFMAHLVNRMADALQRICSELRPAILEDLGLAAAMQWQASTFEHRTGLRCIVTIKGLDRLDSEQSTGLFRVFQELLTHAPLHPGATVVWVTMKEEATGLTLEVSDNGQAAQKNDLEKKIKHFFNLNERLLLLRGDLSIQRRAGESASIVVTIPLTVDRPSAG